MTKYGIFHKIKFKIIKEEITMMGEDFNPINEPISESRISTVMQKVFAMMTMGLGVTAITALIVLTNMNILAFVVSTMWVWLIAELILVFMLSLRVSKMGTATCRLTFFIYAIINGITLSPICLVYTGSSVASTFFITAGVFGIMALIGKTTKKDLTKFGSYLLMGLIGVIIAGIVNIFIQNSMMDFLITIIGLAIFIGLTAYDVQKIKGYSEMVGLSDNELQTQVVVMGALTLYLDFINIFIKLLRLMGKRRND